MKKIIFPFLFIFLITSCTDPVCRAYEVTFTIENVPSEVYECYAFLKDEEDSRPIVFVFLDKNNNFSGMDKPWWMGPQVDLRNPDEHHPLKKTLEQIEAGGVYTIQEVDKDGNKTQKYTIECTKGDVKDVTPDDCLYRCYKITLDWNNKIPIVE